MKHTKQGFTLVELVMVIAIIALIATLAISRLSGVKMDAEKKLNVANLTRIGTALDTYLIANDGTLNRLDGLLNYAEPDASGGTFDVTEFPQYLTGSTNEEHVILNSRLIVSDAPAMYGSFPGLLARYYLTSNDVTALNRIGLKYVMNGTDGGRMRSGDDGSWAQGTVNDPDTVSSVARELDTGFAVAIINPGAVVGGGGGVSPVGLRVYQAAGYDDFGFSTSAQVIYKGTNYSPTSDALLTELIRSGSEGILLAFGVGESSSFVGSNRAGLDSAPICPIISADNEYRRYIVLIRLRHITTGGSEAEYAGIMDATGQPIMEARAAIN